MQNEPDFQAAENKTNEDKNGLKYFKSILRVFVVLFTGLSIFFIAGFIVIKLRVADKSELRTPDLIGKLFIDEYNALFDEGFRIEIDHAYSTEYPQGYILAQNLSPGEIVKEGDKLILLVNRSKALIEIPKITGISENLVEGLLKDIPVAERKYSLQIGVVTRILDNAPKGEILAQNPLPGTPVIPDFPISILVSEGPDAISYKLKFENLKGADLNVIQKLAYLKKRPLRIETKRVFNENLHGKVLSVEDDKSGSKKGWLARIGKFWYEDDEKNYPFRYRWLDPEEENIPEGVYTLRRALLEDELTAPKNDKNAISKDKENINLDAFLKIEKRPIPVFYNPKEKIVFYKGYVSKRKIPDKPAKIITLDGAEI
ncbi:MAG: PASTA domain-containing protein [Spirochaetia bacterium]|nr:PASTA domain-containing protein [Spirochaetia bacterium]